MTHDQNKKTPLYSQHVSLNAKLVEFAGWEMPILYTGIIQEHTTVRSNAGLFDVSHMGEILVEGKEALEALQYMTCNDVSKLVDFKAQYSAVTNYSGGVIDDIIVYRFSEVKYLLCVNASNVKNVFHWLTENNKFEANITDISDKYAQIALQGPRAEKVISECGFSEAIDLTSFQFLSTKFKNQELLIARTGYTGEDGYELFVSPDLAVGLWQLLLERGASEGIVPVGLGARDTLRLEACFPLHGHELGEEISAIESGLGWIVKVDNGDFIGRDILVAQKEEGAPRKLVGLVVEDKGVVREGVELFAEDGSQIGQVSSGTLTPTVGKAIALAIIDRKYGKLGDLLTADVRGRKVSCRVVKKPFYKRSEVSCL